MELNFYQKQALRTSGAGHDRIKNGCLGLIGESGEIVDIVKKFMFQSKADTPLPVDNIIKEAGDVLWYCAETASGMEIPLQLIAGTPGDTHWRDACADLDLEQTVTSLAGCACTVYNAFFVADKLIGALDQLCGVYALLEHLCGLVDTTIDHVAETNIAKLRKRYPDGFDPERSMNRPEYGRKEQTESTPGILFNERNRTI